MYDASTIQFCNRFARGVLTNDPDDILYLAVFHAFRHLNFSFRSIRTIQNIIKEYFKSKYICQDIEDITYRAIEVITNSIVLDRTARVVSGIIENVTLNGVGYKVPIFAISSTNSIFYDGKKRMGITIYDDLIHDSAEIEEIKTTFLYNITLYAMYQHNVKFDFVEYIYRTHRPPSKDKNIFSAHKKVLIKDPEFNFALLNNYNNMFKLNKHSVYNCGTCKLRKPCWSTRSAKDY